MSRRRPSRPVLPSRVPGAKWVQVSLFGEIVYWVLGTGADWAAIVQRIGPGWATVPVGSHRFVTTIGAVCSTKREAMRWVERRVKP